MNQASTSFMLFEQELNQHSQTKTPFFFLIDFEMEKPLCFPLSMLDGDQLQFRFKNHSKEKVPHAAFPKKAELGIKQALSFDEYKKAFNYVQKRQYDGDSWLTNLTFATEITSSASLYDIYHAAKAPYKIYFNDEFVLFSPEPFIQIQNGIISSYPMKGTIDASLPDAASALLSDKKEAAEHLTITDLIRNDLNRVCLDTWVSSYRYLEKIVSHGRELYQASSKISGRLDPFFQCNIGSLLSALLPAGSVSGAPKRETVSIIRSAEKGRRGYYSGVAGIFDGESLDSCVMIRYLEKRDGRFYYRSGGGVTIYSDPHNEYRELLQKIYVPLG